MQRQHVPASFLLPLAASGRAGTHTLPRVPSHTHTHALTPTHSHSLPLTPTHSHSSQATSMLPEGPGYLLFETIPRGEPPLAAHVKTEREWKRSEVEATTRTPALHPHTRTHARTPAHPHTRAPAHPHTHTHNATSHMLIPLSSPLHIYLTTPSPHPPPTPPHLIPPPPHPIPSPSQPTPTPSQGGSYNPSMVSFYDGER